MWAVTQARPAERTAVPGGSGRLLGKCPRIGMAAAVLPALSGKLFPGAAAASWLFLLPLHSRAAALPRELSSLRCGSRLEQTHCLWGSALIGCKKQGCRCGVRRGTEEVGKGCDCRFQLHFVVLFCQSSRITCWVVTAPDEARWRPLFSPQGPLLRHL